MLILFIYHNINLIIQALWWSKSGYDLAFLTTDDSNVSHVNIPVYAQNQYPHNIRQAYPKTGASQLPIVSLNIWHKITGETKKLSLAKIDPRFDFFTNKYKH